MPNEGRHAALAWLRQARLFEHAAEADLAGLAEQATWRSFAPGEVLARCGDAADTLLVVVDGQVAVEEPLESGEGGGVRTTLGPGDTLGELTVFEGTAHGATAVARTQTVALCLPREALLAAIRASPDLAVALLTTLAGWARRADRRAAELALRSAGPAPFAFRRLRPAPGELPGPPDE